MDGVAYFVRAVSYICKKFMKLTTGATVIKNLTIVSDGGAK
jgi:hypothetical protein